MFIVVLHDEEDIKLVKVFWLQLENIKDKATCEINAFIKEIQNKSRIIPFYLRFG